MSEPKYISCIPKKGKYFEPLWFKKYGDDMKIKGFENMAKLYVTSLESKGKFYNNKNKFKTV